MRSRRGVGRSLPTALCCALALHLAAHPATPLAAQTEHPRDAEIHDSDTVTWWHTTEALAGDDMEGRDTGTAAYLRAAHAVAHRFALAGLQPAGDAALSNRAAGRNTAAEDRYLQPVPMHQIDTLSAGTRFVIDRDTSAIELAFLEEITATWTPGTLLKGVGPLSFRGYCGRDNMGGLAGRIAVCFGTQRSGLPTAAERLRNVRAAGALGILTVDDPGFTLEPPRWPQAYARSVTLRESPSAAPTRIATTPPPTPPPTPTMLPPMRVSAAAFTRLLEGSGQDAAALLKAGGAKLPLPSFELQGRLNAQFAVIEKDITSPNILAILPGTDAALSAQYVVAGAHLDGYGYGTPVARDALYNGALDDAAYVALLLQMADDIHAGRLPRPRRSLLLCVFTGEEKGLLGSTWFVRHPTVPLRAMAADVNLDQLRPLFPLNALTAEAVNDSTLGATARAVGRSMGIAIREDAEPERNLLRRADQYPFLALHVPAISFIFAYDPGTDPERLYRQWYQTRYHRPQDDLTQPIDFDAAAKFDQFFYRLVAAIANASERPAMLPGTPFAAR